MKVKMKEYLIENGLVDENLELIESSFIPPEARPINDEVVDEHEAAIILCSVIKSVRHLDEIQFGLQLFDGYWKLWVWWKDDLFGYYEEDPTIEPVLKTINMLLPYMASSNISYLAGQMVSDE